MMKDLIKALLVIVFSLSLLAYDHYNYKIEKQRREIDAKNKSVQSPDDEKYKVSTDIKNDTLTANGNSLYLAGYSDNRSKMIDY